MIYVYNVPEKEALRISYYRTDSFLYSEYIYSI